MQQYFLLLTFSLISFSVYSQSKNLNINETANMLCKNWKLTKIISNGENIPVLMPFEINYLKDKNYTCKTGVDGKLKLKGKWKITINNKDFYILNNEESMKIISLDNKSLIISKKSNNEILYFSSKENN